MTLEEKHEKYMERCLELARKGLGFTAPNPMAGCIIVHNNRIIGEGFHRSFGSSHAEVNAIKSVKDTRLMQEATLYVTLEPCSHYGKTPPCAKLIIETGIPSVVIGVTDPNPIVSGKGIKALIDNGLNVITDVCKDKCISLNKRFFTFFLKKRPYIILKWAETTDGFIDIIRKEGEENRINWITDETSRMLVHKWRSEEQAVLVGSNTAILDNPQLNVRNWPGKNPIRLVIDREGRIPAHLNLRDGTVRTVIFTYVSRSDSCNLNYILIDRREDIITALINYLVKNEIQSLIVEGGKILLEEFIRRNLWDEARVFTGNKTFGTGVGAPVLHSDPIHQFDFSGSIVRIYKNYGSY